MKYFVIFLLKMLKSKHLSQKQFKNNWLVKLAIVPILRAGIGMVDGLLLSLVPKLSTLAYTVTRETLSTSRILGKIFEDIDQRQFL